MKKITCVTEFIKEIFQLDSDVYEYLEEDPEKSIKEYGDMYFYRGQPSKNYELIPSIGRTKDGGIASDAMSLLDKEAEIIELAKNEYPQLFPNTLSSIDLLSNLQQYGFPTRLLDITRNPLVALYFACQPASKGNDNTGEVFIFKKNNYFEEEFPLYYAIAESYKYDVLRHVGGSIRFDNFIKNYFKKNMMYWKPKYFEKYYESWLSLVINNLMIINTKKNTQRQKNQQGMYILFPNKVKEENDKKFFCKGMEPLKKEVVKNCDNISFSDNKLVKIFHIHEESKKHILYELNILGINKEFLFPEEINGISFLKNYYKKDFYLFD